MKIKTIEGIKIKISETDIIMPVEVFRCEDGKHLVKLQTRFSELKLLVSQKQLNKIWYTIKGN